MLESLSLARRVGYALGNAGFNITGNIVVGVGLYYYLPPGDVEDLIPQLGDGIFLGVLTAYGLARLIGGLFDSLADPFVGHYSDRSRSRLGRRRSFMIWGIVPMVVAPALIFFPPGEPGSPANFVYLSTVLAFYFVFFTVYVAPYLALLPEIARTQEQRVELSRLFAIVGFPILVFFGPAWQLGVDAARDAGIPTETALRIVVVIFSVLAFLICLAPILAIDEKKLSHTVRSDLSLKAAVMTTVRNRPFVIYLMAQILFILGITMVGPLVPFVSEVILGRDLSFSAVLGLGIVPTGVLGFLAVNWVVRRIGPKNTTVLSVATLGVFLCLLGLVEPDVPGGPRDTFNLVIVWGVLAMLGPPMAAFMIVPNVIIGQLVDLDEVHTGASRSAMYFGAQGLFTKWAYAASAAIMSYLFVAFGNSRAEPLGVVLVGPVAGVLCLVSAAIYLLYPEKRVLAETRRARVVDD